MAEEKEVQNGVRNNERVEQKKEKQKNVDKKAKMAK